MAQPVQPPLNWLSTVDVEQRCRLLWNAVSTGDRGNRGRAIEMAFVIPDYTSPSPAGEPPHYDVFTYRSVSHALVLEHPCLNAIYQFEPAFNMLKKAMDRIYNPSRFQNLVDFMKRDAEGWCFVTEESFGSRVCVLAAHIFQHVFHDGLPNAYYVQNEQDEYGDVVKTPCVVAPHEHPQHFVDQYKNQHAQAFGGPTFRHSMAGPASYLPNASRIKTYIAGASDVSRSVQVWYECVRTFHANAFVYFKTTTNVPDFLTLGVVQSELSLGGHPLFTFVYSVSPKFGTAQEFCFVRSSAVHFQIF